MVLGHHVQAGDGMIHFYDFRTSSPWWHWLSRNVDWFWFEPTKLPPDTEYPRLGMYTPQPKDKP